MPACEDRWAMLSRSCVPPTPQAKRASCRERHEKRENLRAEDMIPGDSHFCLTHISALEIKRKWNKERNAVELKRPMQDKKTWLDAAALF